MITSDDIGTLHGATVYGTDNEKIGSVSQVFVDDADGSPTWVTVHTGLFGLSESFVPLAGARLGNGELHVEHPKPVIKDAPRTHGDGTLTAEDEDRLYSYYSRSAPAGNGTAAGERTHTFSEAQDADSDTPPDDSHHGASMTRSEEHLKVGTERVEATRVRLRKYIVTEYETVRVPVSHEEVRLERVPITDAEPVPGAIDGATADANLDARDAADRSRDNLHTDSHNNAPDAPEPEIILHAERVVVSVETVPIEIVRLGKETVTENTRVTEPVRSERIEIDGGTQGTATAH